MGTIDTSVDSIWVQEALDIEYIPINLMNKLKLTPFYVEYSKKIVSWIWDQKKHYTETLDGIGSRHWIKNWNEFNEYGIIGTIDISS